MVAQSGATGEISSGSLSRAEEGQEESLTQLKKALEKLLEGEGDNSQKDQAGQQQQQGRQEQERQEQQEQQEEQTKRSETARDILDEEKENREKRKQAAGGYRKVDKDW
jgi:hypothetical protein